MMTSLLLLNIAYVPVFEKEILAIAQTSESFHYDSLASAFCSFAAMFGMCWQRAMPPK